MSKVLFTSQRPLYRAENISAVYEAYDGPKKFAQLDERLFAWELLDPQYDVLVTDEFITAKHPNCTAVFIGHGIPGGKLFGLDQKQPYLTKEFAELIDFAVTSSKNTVPIVAKQCGLPEDRVMVLGMPRTDDYFKEWPKQTNQRVYLYAPTFRASNETPAPDIDWQLLDDHLGDDELFIVKAHMIGGHVLPDPSGLKHIKEIPADVPTTPYLMQCDVLVTDYSSIIMDAHVAGKPVVLFEKSVGYTDTRGMYLDYPLDYAGRYCTNEVGLAYQMKFADKPTVADRRCRKRTAAACDGHSTERVVKFIKDVIAGVYKRKERSKTMRKILIAVPCLDQCPIQFAHSLATLTSYGIPDTKISIWFNSGSLVYTSRNEIAKKALLDEADLVMWFDSDMVFNPDTLIRLLKHIDDGADMVCGIYYRRTPPFTPTVFKTMEIDEKRQEAVWEEFEEIPNELFEVAGCGFGCVLMKTEIFVATFGKFGNMFAPIGNIGEDIAFCWRARKCGYKIMADPSIGLGHVGNTIITADFFRNYQLTLAKQQTGKEK